TAEIKLERLRFDKPLCRHVVDHEVSKIGLPSDGAKRREFRRREARNVIGVGVGIGNPVEDRRLRRSGEAARLTEVTKDFGYWLHRSHLPGTGRRMRSDRRRPAMSVCGCPALTGNEKGVVDPVEARSCPPSPTLSAVKSSTAAAIRPSRSTSCSRMGARA